MTFRLGMIPGAALAVLIGLAAPQGADARATSVEEAQASAPALTLNKPEPEIFRLKNGMTVYYLKGDRLPLVTVRALVRAGTLWEPGDAQGAASLTGRMMRTGGTARWTADEIDEQLDFLAARLGVSVGNEQANVTLDVLSENLEPALAIFAEILRHPAFASGKMDVQKNLIKEDIRRENDSPIQAAFREYQKMLWGADHPRARTPTEETVDALTRENLVAFHERFFQPGSIMLGVTGNVSRKQIQKMLDRTLGDWNGTEVSFPPMPPAPEVAPRVALGKKKIPQTTVVLGHLGPREEDPFRAAGQVMMDILGSGGFTSYIVDRVRNDEGLAYFAGGFLQFGRMDRGGMVALALSKTETTCQATDLILEQIERIQTIDVTDTELRRARDGILNSQAFEYDSAEQIVATVMNLAYYGLPEDHDEKIIAAIGQVSKADVQAAAKALIDPANFSMIAVGNPDGMDCAWGKYAERLGVELREMDLE